MANKHEKLDALLRTNFGAFTKKVFQSTSPGRDYQHAWYLDAIAYKFELVRQGKIKRLIVNLPPRSLKSTAAAIALPAFLLGLDPTLRIITVAMMAILDLTESKNIIRCENCGKLFVTQAYQAQYCSKRCIRREAACSHGPKLCLGHCSYRGLGDARSPTVSPCCLSPTPSPRLPFATLDQPDPGQGSDSRRAGGGAH